MEFNLNYIKNAAKEVANNNIVSYDDLPQYDLFLSQVIDYLNDKFDDEKYTSNIVQNYIKSEVISKPEDGKKRGYKKEHLAQLALLSYMRPILTTDEIKKIFSLVFNDINNREDDIITWENAYKIFSTIQNEMFDQIISKSIFNEKELDRVISENDVQNEDKQKIMVFIVVMTLIAQASGIKKLVKRIVDEYQNN